MSERFAALLVSACAAFAAAGGPVAVTLAKGADSGWRVSDAVTRADGVETHAITLRRDGAAAVPPVVEIAFDEDVGATSYYWQPINREHALFGAGESSKFCFGVPVRAFVDDGDRNRLTLAWDECVRAVDCSQRIVHEKPGSFFFHVTLRAFAESEAPITEWKMRLRLDRRDGHWSDAVREAAKWVSGTCEAGCPGAGTPSSPRIPDAAYGAVYSTWYAFNRAFDEKILERECAEAARLGMKTLITDDGWQTTHGDWEPVPAKFADMRAHVERVHKLGMKYVLWYAISFMNELSRHYPEFKGKYLAAGPFWEHRLGMLDPRFPEVRKFISDQLVELLEKWNLDGYKLDFIDYFRFYGPNPYEPTGGTDPAVAGNYAGRDYRSVPEAARRLLEDVTARLRAKKPDILLEFRQPYIGPVTAACGNMLRANDCPGDTTANRVRTTDIRLTSGAAAVHSDMLKWTPSANRCDAARSILAVIFTTVQYSMVLDTIPAAQKDEIRRWIAFANAHRAALQQGGFRAYRPADNYPLLEGWSDTERIFAVYDPHVAVPVPADGRRVTVINATPARRILVETSAGVRSIPAEPYSEVSP